MAQLKDSLITGDLRVTGTIYGDVPLNDLVDADDLKAIEALSGTSGLLKKTAANTWTLDTNAYTTSSGVTSVTIATTSPLTGGSSTAITSTGTRTIALADGYGDTKNPYASKTARYVLAAPASAAGVPTFRALTNADVGLGNVENTKLSTWTGSTAITTLGTITTGTIPWANISGKPSQATAWPNWSQIQQSGAENISEGSSDVTDNTEIFTSYASNNGFADTNAKGVVYRRDAIKLYNYIKGKTDALYATVGHNHDSTYVNVTGDTMTGLLNITLNGNTVTLGSQNSSYTHIYNSANIPFIFNKDILVTNKQSLGNTSFPIGRIQLGKADDGIYYQGTKNNYRMIRMLDNTADTYGNGIGIGGGGVAILGSGEFTDSLISAKSLTGGDENTYIGSDGSVFIEGGGNTIANRIGIQIDTSGNIIPVKAEAGNNNAQSLGSSSYKWSNVYATTFTGALSGNATSATGFASAKTIALTGNVTGSATGGNGANGWSIATTIGSGVVTNAMLAGSIANGKLVNSKVTIAGNDVSLGGSLAAATLKTSLGLNSAMHYIGKATVAITDGSTTDPKIGGNATTLVSGDVVIDSSDSREYVWNGSAWELLGGDSSYKVTQTAVTDAAYSGSDTATTFVSAVTQNANGEITVTKRKLPTYNNYSHPTGDGNKHVPANGTSNNGKFLQATATAGTYQWASLPTASTTGAGIIQIGTAATNAAAGNHTHTTSLTQTGTATINLAANTAYTLTAGGTSVIFKTPADNNTNYYHTTGSWNGLTYTATANGGAGALAFTIPTGTTGTTVAVGNHTHATSIATSSGTNQITLALGTKYAITAGGTSYVFTMPANPNTDIKQNITLKTTTKGYITAVETAPTGTAAAQAGIADTGVYLTTTAGQINATSYKVAETALISYNTTTGCIEITT